MSEPEEGSLIPVDIIRTETVLSRFPMHSLAKQKKADIQITKKDEHGQTELHWEVSYNSKYGTPGQLAYKIDTLIINRRIDEAARPIPKTLFLGSQGNIHEELGLSQKSKDITKVKKAIRQNVGILIDAKLSYKGKNGTEQQLEATFNRYNVIFTGERFPNGEKADAVYIILENIFWEILNSAPTRPLDYSYLKELAPTAQRFYEIISYRIFAAINNNISRAKLHYSEYCMFSAQTRYYEYQPFRKQMYKVHRPHLASGYIESVEYKQTTDSDGKVDWAMYYIPGPKAKAEYRAFNSKRLFEGKIIDIEKEKPNKEKKHREREKKSASNTQVNTGAVASSPTKASKPLIPGGDLQLVQFFHKLARGVEDYQPHRGSKEKKQAQELLSTYGIERSRFIIDFAVAEAKKTNFQMRTFGAALQYVSDAIAEYERRQRELERKANQEATQHRREEQYMEERLKGISPEQYRDLYEKARAEVLTAVPSLAACQEETGVQLMIKREMVWELDRQARQRSGQ